MEWFACLGDRISDAAQRHLKKMLPLPSCASPGMMGPDTRRSGSSTGARAALWDSKTLAPVKEQTEASAPCARAVLVPSPSAAPSCDSGTNPRVLWPGRGHAARAHAHIRANACARRSSAPSPLPGGCSGHRSLVPSSEHPSLPSSSSTEAGKRWSRAGGSACRTALAVLPRLGNQRNPKRNRRNPKSCSRGAEPPQRHSSDRGWEERARLLPSAEREPARNTCEPESKKIPRRGWLTCWR